MVIAVYPRQRLWPKGLQQQPHIFAIDCASTDWILVRGAGVPKYDFNNENTKAYAHRRMKSPAWRGGGVSDV